MRYSRDYSALRCRDSRRAPHRAESLDLVKAVDPRVEQSPLPSTTPETTSSPHSPERRVWCTSSGPSAYTASPAPSYQCHTEAEQTSARIPAYQGLRVPSYSPH